jgi:hypothetical protein
MTTSSSDFFCFLSERAQQMAPRVVAPSPRRRGKRLAGAVIAMTMWTSGAYGLVYTVNTTNDFIVAGACANGTAGCSLRDAMTEARAHSGEDQIVLAIPSSDPGCVDGVCTINLTAQLPDIIEAVSISGPGPEQMIVRRATGGDYRIFRSSAAGPVSFTGFTISHGSLGDTLGGGILNASIGTMTIDNCIVSNNIAFLASPTGSARGGGIANTNGGRIDITNTDDLESAIVATLTPNGYTAIVRGKNDTTGVALVEAYQLDN